MSCRKKKKSSSRRGSQFVGDTCCIWWFVILHSVKRRLLLCLPCSNLKFTKTCTVVQKCQYQLFYLMVTTLLKVASEEIIPLLCKCSILLGLTFVEIKNSFTKTLLVFNSKNFRIICYWKKTDESEPI